MGSTSYITDSKGDISQFIGYMPFGEAFVEQHSDYDSPFKFNGKELDGETGLVYVHARYLDPRLGRWLSVDPLAEKYSSLSPYNFCYNNPIMFVDPTGMEGLDTHIYDLKGNYVTTIDDDHKDEVVFMDGLFAQSYKRQNDQNKGNKKELNQLGSNARNRAKARFTQNTANQLKSFYDKAYSKSNNEPGGILWIDPQTRELNVYGYEGDGGNSFDLWDLIDGGVVSGDFIGKSEIGGDPFAIWHGHPGEGFQNSSVTTIGGNDHFADEKEATTNKYFKRFFTGGAIGMIVTKGATTIYPMYQNIPAAPFIPTYSKKYTGSVTSNQQWGVFAHKGLKLQTFWTK